MKQRRYFKVFLFILTALLNRASAQTNATSTLTPPKDTVGIDRIITLGQVISITGKGSDLADNALTYYWYKINSSVPQLISTTKNKTYTETPSAIGYYSYQLIIEDKNGNKSPASNIFKVFVLPQFQVTITGTNDPACLTTKDSVSLAAVVSPNNGYRFYYQWTVNGSNVNGATQNIFTQAAPSANAVNTYGVSVTCSLNLRSPFTAAKVLHLTSVPQKPQITSN